MSPLRDWWNELSSRGRVLAGLGGFVFVLLAISVVSPQSAVIVSPLLAIVLIVAAGFGVRRLMQGGKISGKTGFVVAAVVAVIGIGFAAFNYSKTHNEWYRSGYDAADSPSALKSIRAGLGPFQFCSQQQTLAALSGADESEASKTFDGCRAGLKHLLGSSEYDRLLRAEFP